MCDETIIVKETLNFETSTVGPSDVISEGKWDCVPWWPSIGEGATQPKI